ncbi:hypothetical protein EVAR_44144_1 [Eumeta japonica]|uniref:Uncharacterized protein n=1 Tax=Eumeta variegata TaxID=151549 RepID=A0A4C1XJV7_EUMVA|nr:hypothetical protein EVAR_44144_1 [Eumeta japonica]
MASQEQLKDTFKTLHDCRGRKRMKASEQINDGASTPAVGATEAMQVDDVIASISTLDYNPRILCIHKTKEEKCRNPAFKMHADLESLTFVVSGRDGRRQAF